MGRAALEWTTAQLASAAGVSVATVHRFERGGTAPTANNLGAIRRAMEAAGLEFTNGSAPGVRMKPAGVP